MASQKAPAILSAAEDGRIETLFAGPPIPTPWSLGGVHASEEGLAALEIANQENEWANGAVLATLNCHGKVYRLNPGELHPSTHVAAIFRY